MKVTAFKEPTLRQTDPNSQITSTDLPFKKSALARENIFASRDRLPCLDGCRAIAIAIVIGSHCKRSFGFPAEFGRYFDSNSGGIGVRFFFVISGFLITLLMLRESSHRPFSLKRFWIRRSLRILPVYFAFLFTLFLLQSFASLRISTVQWVGAITFTYNYIEGPWLPSHLWSLCVEEQFYLIWPFAFRFIGGRPRLLGGMAFFVFASAVASRNLGFAFGGSQFFGRPSLITNMDSLAVGCSLAYLAYWRGDLLARSKYPTLSILIGGVLIGLPYFYGRDLRWEWLTVPFGTLAQSCGFGTLIIASIVSANDWRFSWLQWKPVVWLGTLSYSLYIWQQLFCTQPSEFGFEDAWCLRFPSWIGAALLVSVASYFLIESPFLRLKRWAGA